MVSVWQKGLCLLAMGTFASHTPDVVVIGEGQVTAVADGMSLHLSVGTVNEEMGKAKSSVNSILNDLITVLNSYGAKYDLGTLQVREETDWNTRKRLGVAVEQSIIVKVSKVTQEVKESADGAPTKKVSSAQEISTLMIEDVLSVPSSESIRVESVEPYLSDTETAKQEALGKATQNCIDRGNVIANVFNRYLDTGDVRVEMLADEGVSTFRSTLESSKSLASLGASDGVTISARVKCTFS